MTEADKIDFRELNQRLLCAAKSLLFEWLPGGKMQGVEYVCAGIDGGKGSSFQVNTRTGVWKDFALDGTGGGDLVSLYAAVKRIRQGEAAEELGARKLPPAPEYPPEDRKDEYTPVLPAPDNAGTPVRNDGRIVLWSANKNTEVFYSKPALTHEYRDGAGRLLGYIFRVNMRDGKKIFVPAIYCRDGSGTGRWLNKQFPKPRPLYGLDKIGAAQKILIVEGEKAADAARAMFGGKLAAVTWPGGSHAVPMVDWQPLAGKDCVIWPDADEPGVKAAHAIAGRLQHIAGRVRIVDVQGLPEGHDAADEAAAGKNGKQVLQWLAERMRDYAPDTPPPAEDKDSGAGTRHIDIYSPLPHIRDNGAPLATPENLAEICRRAGIGVRYNVIAKREELVIPEADYSPENAGPASLAYLTGVCALFRMGTDKLNAYLTLLAEENRYNPAQAWILSREWDGVSRLTDICETITAVRQADNEDIHLLKQTLITKWLLSAVAAAFAAPGTFAARGVLVLQGGQGIGKTSWFRRLMPAETELVQDSLLLRLDEKDSVTQAISTLITELGELDATFRKSDIAALKAFVTRTEDRVRRPYAAKESVYARRTVFGASVNHLQFLHDDTGNSRFWTIQCEAIDYAHNIDMQQVFAELLTHYRAGYSWHLTAEEERMLTLANGEHESADPIDELLLSRYDWTVNEMFWTWRSATEILKEMGFDRPNRSDVTRCGMLVRRLNGDRCDRERNAGRRRVLLLPERKC